MNYKKTTLKNGLRIITAPMRGTKTATVIVMVGVGSRYETEKEAGLSHFIEHMFFKGTTRRPTTLDISTELDSVGGEFNAFTGQDRTAYYAKVDAKHVNRALDVVADMFLNSKIDSQEINREKGTILQELNMYEDTPTRNVSEIFENLLYDGNPLGRAIVGYKKTIKAFKREDFLNYMNRFYMANDTVICVAGKFNEDQVLKKLQSDFENMGRGEKPHFIPVKEGQKIPQLKIKYKETDQTHFVIGTRAYHHEHKDRFALAVLAVILGGNMSSRLFIEVRERRGLAYYVRTSADAFKDCGYLATQAGVEHKNLEKAIETILREYKKISQEKVSELELQRAKDYLKGKTVMTLEESDEMATFFVEQEVTKGKIMIPEELFSHIDKVTTDDILRVAKDIFSQSKLNLAIIGPHKNKQKLTKLLTL